MHILNRDREDYILNRSEELRESRYPNANYDDLPDSIQQELFQQAEADWTDHYSSMIDAAYDRAVEAQLFSQYDGD